MLAMTVREYNRVLAHEQFGPNVEATPWNVVASSERYTPSPGQTSPHQSIMEIRLEEVSREKFEDLKSNYKNVVVSSGKQGRGKYFFARDCPTSKGLIDLPHGDNTTFFTFIESPENFMARFQNDGIFYSFGRHGKNRDYFEKTYMSDEEYAASLEEIQDADYLEVVEGEEAKFTFHKSFDPKDFYQIIGIAWKVYLEKIVPIFYSGSEDFKKNSVIKAVKYIVWRGEYAQTIKLHTRSIAADLARKGISDGKLRRIGAEYQDSTNFVEVYYDNIEHGHVYLGRDLSENEFCVIIRDRQHFLARFSADGSYYQIIIGGRDFDVQRITKTYQEKFDRISLERRALEENIDLVHKKLKESEEKEVTHQFLNAATAESIGAAIFEARDKLGMTQEELSEISGLSLRSIQALEKGRANPSLSNLISVANSVGLFLPELMPKD